MAKKTEFTTAHIINTQLNRRREKMQSTGKGKKKETAVGSERQNVQHVENVEPR